MPALHYLTVQDILWINLQVTKKVHHYSFARLEEATFYQYAYGESNSLVSQAGRFLGGFLKMHPIDAGNEATAFVGCLSFLRMNGYQIDLADDQAITWMHDVLERRVSAADAVARIAKPDDHAHHDIKPDVRRSIQEVMRLFSCTVLQLAAAPAAP